MNGNPYLSEALASLSQSASILRSLSFSSRAVLPRCVLATDDWFETHLIRDAAPNEIALFDPNPASYPVVQLELDDPLLLAAGDPNSEAHRLAVAKRRAPKRTNLNVDGVTPPTTATTRNQPERCLLTARKLLDVYAMPRAQEHVEALHAQLQGLLESISETEQALKRPPSRTAPQPRHDQSYYRQLELEDEIKREKLELLALEQIKADKQAEIEALAAAANKATAKAKPTPRSSFGSNGPATAKPTAAAGNGHPVRPTRTPRISTSSATATSPRKEGTVPPPPRASTTTTSRTSTASSPRPQRRRSSAAPVPVAEEEVLSSSSSPARRPIGRPSVVPSVVGQSAMKRRVDAARARVQASAQATPNRREAFASFSSGGGGGGGDGGRGAEEDESAAGGRGGRKKDDELAPPIPMVDPTSASPATTTPAPGSQPAAAAAAAAAVEEEEPQPLPAGVSLSELEGANKTVWTTLGEASGLKAWARKWSAAAARETGKSQDDSASNKNQAGSDWRDTIDILAFALAESASSPSPASNTPNSPSGHSTLSFATSTTTATGGGGGGADDANAPAPSWTPAQVVEARLCHLLLSTFAGRRHRHHPGSSSSSEADEDDDLPALNIILRETAIPLSSSTSADSATSAAGISSRKTPHLAMSVLKAHLGRFAKGRGWTEEMGTTAIYALVSKQTVKIDRRGREGAAVGFKAMEL